MDRFIQLALSGIANGAIFALVALGFVLIYKSSDVINFAQGELLLIGAYLTYAMVEQFGLWWPAGVIIAVVLAAIVGVLIEQLVLRPLIGEPVISVIMVTIGLSSLLRAIVGAIWGVTPRPAPQFLPTDTATILGANVGVDRIWAFGLAITLFVVLTLFFRYSREGIAMRAVADDQQAALSMGISVKKVWAVAWAIAAITAAVGGILLMSIFGGVSGTIARVGLIVFPVVILGGLDSIPGAIIGGLIIGLLQSFAGGYLPPEWGLGEVVPFIVLLLILLVRPYGLFGQRIIERV
ncbi:MAG: branched-chain amino acid ABC transporter permease [Chloroflexus sp.]|jgi:branched-chain amino acid transport system permease protein|nr:branched-chain amino acid ABC transporter permease [Chloroflexus sp.]MBO9315394.1 branched-chain amino acid ABC transporter permease [Chloroflexus sp.]MBO9318425.1 branched-chain amino acid ABC transporter permease [Chloroflexus sp.]MBO9373333.1 branched-chain amino acid ABC transporter permease [Chloroflexus sp.]